LDEPEEFVTWARTALAGVHRRQLIETQLTEIACVLVAEKAGLSLVDSFSASEFAGRGVAFRPFRPDIFDAVVLTQAVRPMPTLATEALDMIRGAARAMCGGRVVSRRRDPSLHLE
jgi:hypothetical protein